MKNFKSYICFVLALVLLLISSCGKNYEDTKKILNGQTFYYNGGSNTSLNGLIFSENKVIIKNVIFDGNGKHNVTENEYEYTIDEKNITINNDNKLVIPYQSDGKTITLGDGNTYLDEKKVHEGLKGYWNCTTSQYILGKLSKNQYNIFIEDNIITYEYAALRFGTENDYYYYEPKSGEYSLNFGGFDTSVGQGNSFFFNIIDGKAVLLRYDHLCTESDGLPGENGYSFN